MIGAIIAGISAAAGIGMQLYGASESKEASRKAAAQQKRDAKKYKQKVEKKIIPLLKEQGKMERQASKASEEAEKLRKQQMELDALRTRRNIMRDAARTRAMSLAVANAQGAKDGSGFFGALAQVTGEEARQKLGLAQNLEIGRGIFSFNLASSTALRQAAKLRTKENIQRSKLGTALNESEARTNATLASSQGSSYAALGSSLVSASGAISRIGESALFGSSANYDPSWGNTSVTYGG
jgi:hypothetical protein